MNGQVLFHTRWRIAGVLPFWLFIAASLLSNIAIADSLRITSWNLDPASAIQNTTPTLEKTAAMVRAANPDVILLQGVEDWKMCERLAEMLQPGDYRVLVCSAFQGTSLNATGQTQVAILSKQKAYFTWCQPWNLTNRLTAPQGVAFAAIEAGPLRIGLFSAVCTSKQTEDGLAQRILDQLQLVRHWETNRVQTFVIAAALDSSTSQASKSLRRATAALQDAGLVDVVAEVSASEVNNVPPGAEAGGTLFFAGPSAFPFPVGPNAQSKGEHGPVTCELELDPDKVDAAFALRSESRREHRGGTEGLGESTRAWVKRALGLGAVIGVGVWLVRKNRRRPPARQRSTLPIRVDHKTRPAPLRPIIFAEAPPRNTARAAGTGPLLVRPSRPVLRLQTKPKSQEESGSKQPPPIPPEEDGEPHCEIAVQPNLSGKPEPVGHSAPTRENQASEGLIKEWSRWLKSKLVRKLVSDRAQLMEAQQLATRMAHTLDHRLARIEAQLQQQNQAYIRRIEELNLELAAAREENRALIRERIAQVKAEMEAARAKLLAEADLDNTSLRL